MARAIHFPTMLSFVVFIVIHFILVFATAALENLNHMFAGTEMVNWAGFRWFVAWLAVAAAAWSAAQPMIVAPVANIFGKVSNR